MVFLTMHRDATFARRALEAGASGFVLKHSASVELLAALHAALEGKTYLTPQLAGEVLEAMRLGPERPADPAASLTLRQREVLQLLAEGRSGRRSPRACRSRYGPWSSTKLSAEEKAQLDKSAAAVKELIDVLKQKTGA